MHHAARTKWTPPHWHICLPLKSNRTSKASKRANLFHPHGPNDKGDNLDKKTKEMLGLVASMVLRCDDCIKYHLGKNHELGITTEQLYEIFAVANIVGGTIVIPHTRRAAEYWEELGKNAQ